MLCPLSKLVNYMQKKYKCHLLSGLLELVGEVGTNLLEDVFMLIITGSEGGKSPDTINRWANQGILPSIFFWEISLPSMQHVRPLIKPVPRRIE